jgi:hypothetical protein
MALTERQKYIAFGKLKKIHVTTGRETLECKRLKDGTLDVCLKTGKVFGARGQEMAINPDKDGYLCVCIHREKKQRRGKPERSGESVRFRERRTVLVHRLVKMKAIAVALGGHNWRLYVRDIRGIDVNHFDRSRTNNHHENLMLESEATNRARAEATADECQAIAEFMGT